MEYAVVLGGSRVAASLQEAFSRLSALGGDALRSLRKSIGPEGLSYKSRASGVGGLDDSRVAAPLLEAA